MLSRTEYEGLSPGDKPPTAALANGKPPASAKAGDGDAAKMGGGARADGKAGGGVKGTPQENGAAAPREKGTQLDGATSEPRKASSSGSQKVRTSRAGALIIFGGNRQQKRLQYRKAGRHLHSCSIPPRLVDRHPPHCIASFGAG